MAQVSLIGDGMFNTYTQLSVVRALKDEVVIKAIIDGELELEEKAAKV